MRIKDASSVLSVKKESIIPKIVIRKKAKILQPSTALVLLKGARFAISDIYHNNSPELFIKNVDVDEIQVWLVLASDF